MLELSGIVGHPAGVPRVAEWVRVRKNIHMFGVRSAVNKNSSEVWTIFNVLILWSFSLGPMPPENELRPACQRNGQTGGNYKIIYPHVIAEITT